MRRDRINGCMLANDMALERAEISSVEMLGKAQRQGLGTDEGSGVWRVPWREPYATFAGSKSDGFSKLLEDLELEDQLGRSEWPAPSNSVQGCDLDRSERPTLPDGPACGFDSPIRIGPVNPSDDEVVDVRRSA